MEETEIFSQLSAIAAPTFAVTFGDDSERAIRSAANGPQPTYRIKWVSTFGILIRRSTITIFPIIKNSLPIPLRFARSGRLLIFILTRVPVLPIWKTHRNGAG